MYTSLLVCFMLAWNTWVIQCSIITSCTHIRFQWAHCASWDPPLNGVSVAMGKSWSGKGVMSFTVFLFWRYRLKTVHSKPFVFSTHSIGTTWCATAGTHHFVVVYHPNSMDNSSQKCSGHFSSQYQMCLSGSIKLILYLTSHRWEFKQYPTN